VIIRSVCFIALYLTTLSAYAFEGKYKLALPFEIIEVLVEKDVSAVIVENPHDLFTISSYVTSDYLDLTISWMNDGSPELARVVFVKNPDSSVRISESFVVYNDGEPTISLGDVWLISFVKKQEPKPPGQSQP
jgi:hypothetical protein